MKQKIFALLASLALALAFGWASAPPASAAVTGGNLTNECLSSPSLTTAYMSNGEFITVNRCKTTVGSVYAGKVIAFRVPSDCFARSQYSPAGSYPYKGGIKYYYSQNNLHLKIVVSCTI